MIAPIFARSGCPPAVALINSAASRKYSGGHDASGLQLAAVSYFSDEVAWMSHALMGVKVEGSECPRRSFAVRVNTSASALVVNWYDTIPHDL
jgi:hypothetical protein